MGLDSYLSRKTYVGAMWEHRNVQGTIELPIKGTNIPIDLSKVSEIIEQVGYWRKANHIHKWFVDNCAHGADDCREVYVSFEQLKELLALCEAVLSKKVKPHKKLPTTEGFFFGSDDYDDYYWRTTEYTVEVLKEIIGLGELSDVDYYYRGSW